MLNSLTRPQNVENDPERSTVITTDFGKASRHAFENNDTMLVNDLADWEQDEAQISRWVEAHLIKQRKLDLDEWR